MQVLCCLCSWHTSWGAWSWNAMQCLHTFLHVQNATVPGVSQGCHPWGLFTTVISNVFSLGFGSNNLSPLEPSDKHRSAIQPRRFMLSRLALVAPSTNGLKHCEKKMFLLSPWSPCP
jgi:hypothetical protein